MADTHTPPSEAVPAAAVVPTEETPGSIAVGYTATDPVGPSANSGGEGGSGALLAGEFHTPEELAEAYSELKKRLEGTPDAPETNSDKQAEESEDDGNDGTPKAAAIETTPEAAAELKAKGLDAKVFTREFERTGALSEESYAKLEQAGFPRDVVDDYIRGQRVMADTQVKAVKDAVGGEESWKQLAGWAAVSLSTEEQAAYQRALNTADPDLILFAVQGLKARYDAANGSDPEVVVIGAAGSGNDGKSRFRSYAEVTRAMSDERYRNDPAYRSDVEQKLLRSDL